ncbi:MAG TPA: response regulator [Candidatus Thermoplasmatota archaeon]|nr:response regulator [Candidatus Thermoplasmatota archaeon]
MPSANTAAVGQPGSQGRRILLADDDRQFLAATRRLLEGAFPGATVEAVENGADALVALHRQPPDVVVSDLRMPGMDGIELLTAARQTDRDVPRVLLTAFGDLEVAQRALNEASIDRLFVKPVNPEELVTAVATLLVERGSARARQQALVRSLDILARPLAETANLDLGSSRQPRPRFGAR